VNFLFFVNFHIVACLCAVLNGKANICNSQMEGCDIWTVNVNAVSSASYCLQVYTVSEERKHDQLDVDKQLLDVVRQHPERKFMYSYFTSLFSLKSKEYPHKMVF